MPDEEYVLLKSTLHIVQKEQRSIASQLADQNAKLAALTADMETIQRELVRLNNVVRDGNGAPPLTHRALQMESRLDDMEECMKRHMAWHDQDDKRAAAQEQRLAEMQMQFNLSVRQKLIILVAGTLMTLVGSLLSQLIVLPVHHAPPVQQAPNYGGHEK